MTPPTIRFWAAALVPVLVLVVNPLFAQTSPSPQFRETAVIPFFEKRGLRNVRLQTIYERALNRTDTLLLVRAGQWPVKRPDRRRGDGLLGLFLAKTDDPGRVWELGFLEGYFDCFVEVEQADETSIVLSIENEQELLYKRILIFDLTSKRLLKQFDLPLKAVIPFFHERNPEFVDFQTAYHKDLDGTHTLLLVLGGPHPTPRTPWMFQQPQKHFGWAWNQDLGLFLTKTDNPELAWKLTFFDGYSDGSAKVMRSDNNSIVLHIEGEKRPSYTTKIVFDVPSKRLLARWSLPLPVQHILTWNNEVYAAVAHAEQTVILRLENGTPIQVEGDEADSVLAHVTNGKDAVVHLAPSKYGMSFMEESPRKYLNVGSQNRFSVATVVDSSTGSVEAVEGIIERVGDETKLYKLPKSTFAELRRIRPRRAEPYIRSRQPIDEDYIFQEEFIGCFTIAENRFWFGKTFYDGEGNTGIGGFGYFDADKKLYVVFSPPEIAPLSVSTFFVDDKDIWLGLKHRGEWGESPGGLLRYDRASGKAEKFDLGATYDEIIYRIEAKRWQQTTYVATSAGLLVLQDNHLTRYFFGPALNGRIEVFKDPP